MKKELWRMERMKGNKTEDKREVGEGGEEGRRREI